MNLIIIGSGNHAGVVIDSVQKLGEFKIVRLMDNIHAGKSRHGFEVVKISDDWSHCFAFIAIGGNKIREELSKRELNYINVIHPSAQISKQNCRGTYFGANCIVGNNSVVGDFSIINTGVILEHNSQVGDFCHLAPGVVTGGRVKIGNRTMIGLSAVIQDGITIGENCIIGMGSVVTHDISDNCVVWGNPASFRRASK